MRRFAVALFVACLGSAALAAGPKPEEFAARFDLSTPGEGPFFRVALTGDVARYSRSPDFADLRVFNAAGEPVPFALAAPVAEELRAIPVSLAVYPITARVLGAATAGASMQIRNRGGTTTVIVDGSADARATPSADRVAAYLLDTRGIKALGIDVGLDADFERAKLVPITIEASRDLKSWHALATAEPVFRLGEGSEQPSLTRVRFARAEPLEGQFLRLTWSGSERFVLSGASVATIPVARPAPPPDISIALDAPVRDEALEIEWNLPTTVAITGLDVRPTQGNVTAPVTVFGRRRIGEPWVAIGHGVVYRIGPAGSQVHSPPLLVQPGSYQSIKLAFDGRGSLGGAPEVSVRLPPRELVFLARGGPFVLAVGNADAAPTALATGTLIPDYKADAVKSFAQASIGPARIDARRVAPPARALLGTDARTLTLWTVLVGAVALLAWFALSLSRKIKRTGVGREAPR